MAEKDKDKEHAIHADLAPEINARGGQGEPPRPAETKAAVKEAARAAEKAPERSVDYAPVGVQADPALAAEHQRAHDEGWEGEFHRRVEMATRHADEPPLEPEHMDEGKLDETVPLANAPTAAELRAMGREIKPLVEPTDVSTDRYPHKVELYSAAERRRIDETGECPTCGQRLPKALRPRSVAAAGTR